MLTRSRTTRLDAVSFRLNRRCQRSKRATGGMRPRWLPIGENRFTTVLRFATTQAIRWSSTATARKPDPDAAPHDLS